MATTNYAQLVAPIQLGAADGAFYTVPPLTAAKIGRAIFCNTDTAAHSITVNITTGTSNPANQVIAAYVIAPGQTYVSPELAGAVLPAGSSLRGFASTAAVVTVTISGLVVVGQ